MNDIQGNKPSCRQWNILVYSAVNIVDYKRNIIYHYISMKLFSNGTVSYLTVSTYDVLNTTNNNEKFWEL